MKTGLIQSCLAAAFVASLLVSGCLVVTGDDPDGDEHCWDDCTTVTQCETYCDAYSCWEECGDVQSCERVCDSDAHFPNDTEYYDEPDYCYSDLECDDNRICIDNTCTRADTDDRGSAGLCQTCESTSDCVEDGALCLGFTASSDSSEIRETVCGRACDSDAECPGGFECLTIDLEDGGETEQCVPEQEDGDSRTCSASDDLECVVAADCETGESCVDNRCEAPSSAECSDDGECPSGQVCEVFECVDESDSSECVDGQDCQDEEVCLDGECVAPDDGQSCIFNADCGSDDRCVDGLCTATCSGDSECGTNERCREGICEFIECYQSADCAPGNLCVDASCVRACNDTGDCLDGFMCSELGYCEPDPEYECRSSAECAPEEECNDALECEATCTCNDDCSGDDICSSDTGLCQEPSSGDSGVEC